MSLKDFLSPGGMRPTHPARDFDPRLTSEAKPLVPLIKALAAHQRAHGVFPEDGEWPALLAAAGLTPEAATQYRRGDDGKSYRLWRRLGWDPSLEFKWDGAVGTWTFEPGDGSPSSVIKLEP